MHAAPALPVSTLDPGQDSEAAVVLGRASVNDPLLKVVLPHETDLVERTRILTVVFALTLKHQRLTGQPIFGIIQQGKVAAVAITESMPHPATKTPLLNALVCSSA